MWIEHYIIFSSSSFPQIAVVEVIGFQLLVLFLHLNDFTFANEFTSIRLVSVRRFLYQLTKNFLQH